ncbi:hypothetical protein GEMRC1_002959 [Eukaryota sp. GEM-RC1]
MSKPCVVDIKMGTRQHGILGIDATSDKISRAIHKVNTTTSFSLGFRVKQFSMFIDDQFIKVPKSFGRSLDKNAMICFLKEFFQCSNTGLSIPVLTKLFNKLLAIYRVFHSYGDERPFVFYSSSLLIAYDACSKANFDVNIAMIDFAHTHSSFGRDIDDGYAKGLCHLLCYIHFLLLSSGQSLRGV